MQREHELRLKEIEMMRKKPRIGVNETKDFKLPFQKVHNSLSELSEIFQFKKQNFTELNGQYITPKKESSIFISQPEGLESENFFRSQHITKENSIYHYPLANKYHKILEYNAKCLENKDMINSTADIEMFMETTEKLEFKRRSLAKLKNLPRLQAKSVSKESSEMAPITKKIANKMANHVRSLSLMNSPTDQSIFLSCYSIDSKLNIHSNTSPRNSESSPSPERFIQNAEQLHDQGIDISNDFLPTLKRHHKVKYTKEEKDLIRKSSEKQSHQR